MNQTAQAPKINETISYILDKNFSKYTIKSEARNHPHEGSFEYELYDKKNEENNLIRLCYEPLNSWNKDNSDYIQISSPFINHGFDHKENLTVKLWELSAEKIAKRNEVRVQEGDPYMRFDTLIKKVSKITNLNELDHKLVTNINNIFKAYQEMSRTPEVLAKMIIANL